MCVLRQGCNLCAVAAAVVLGGGSSGVIGPCLSPRLMAIGHRLSPLYFFCSPARSFQVSRWSGALRHRIIYCCHGVTGGWGVGWSGG